MINRITLLAVFLIITCTHLSAEADDMKFNSFLPGDREVSISAGWGQNYDIPRESQHISLYTMNLRYATFVSRESQLGYNIGGGVDTVDDGSTIWGNADYRHYFIRRGSTAFAWNFRFGFMYFPNGVEELGGNLNFNEQFGITFQQAVTSSSAITFDCSFSHTSNAGLADPNLGVNATFFSLGYSWFK
ncbi:MAG: acyloxyacyl hydrolase [Armatimonadota bacterium]|nr:acyloxyacyl hydrolase [bacterium]